MARRALLASTTLLVLTALIVPTAAAEQQHAAGERSDAQYYRSALTAIEPATSGLEIVVHEAGDSITLTNRTGRRVVVTGYSGEDYLRVGESEVEENAHSVTASMNANGGRVSPTWTAPPKSAPAKWRPVAAGNSFTWSDLRTRWSAEQRPPIVTAAPHSPHEVFAWAIPITVGKQQALVRGSVTWTGAPRVSEPPALAVIAVSGLLLAAVATALVLHRRRRAPLHRHPV